MCACVPVLRRFAIAYADAGVEPIDFPSAPATAIPIALKNAGLTHEDIALFEVNEAAEIVHNAAHQDANLIFGAVIDENNGDRVSVTVIATGFDQRLANQRRSERPAAESQQQEEPVASQETGDVLDIPAFLRRR